MLPEAIQKSQEYCIDASNNILNPDKTAPPQNSFQLTLQTSDNFLIDETLTGVFAQPQLSAGPFTSAEIELDGSSVAVGELTEILASLELKSALPSGGTFFIKLPDSVFYLLDGQDVECSVNSGSFTSC